MIEEVDSLLSEKVSNLLLTLKVQWNPAYIHCGFILIEYPYQILSLDGRLSASTSKWNLHP